MTNIVYVCGGKGGTTKTAISHLLCLGAILRNQLLAATLGSPSSPVRNLARKVFDRMEEYFEETKATKEEPPERRVASGQ